MNCNVQLRIPIKEDGTLGRAEVVKNTIFEMKGNSTKHVKTNKEKNDIKKKVIKKVANDLFKTTVGNQ